MDNGFELRKGDVPLDRAQSMFSMLQEARRTGYTIDFEHAVKFKPQEVMMVSQDEGVALAYTKDGRFWLGPLHVLAPGMIPTRVCAYVGTDAKRARWRFESAVSDAKRRRERAVATNIFSLKKWSIPDKT